ncbi:hypothetical protein CMU55_19265 [Elizabethkingia anophelis]|nr:hypothetical protein [Elizabethkingia anophelis]
MKRLEEIKNEYALELSEVYKRTFTNWNEMLNTDFERVTGVSKVYDIEQLMDEVAKRYAREVAKASLEKADKEFKNTAAKSIGTALDYFQEMKSETIYKRDVISFLHAFYQFEGQGLSIVGMGYKRYDGKEITDLEGAYEGGYFTEKKKYQITNEQNIVMP